MARYRRSSSITYELESLIRETKENLLKINPTLKLSDNVKELFNDKEIKNMSKEILRSVIPQIVLNHLKKQLNEKLF